TVVPSELKGQLQVDHLTIMDHVKSEKPAEIPLDLNTEGPESDLRTVEELERQQSPPRAKVDRRVRDELIALCQAQEEQRRRIDAANQRRIHRSEADPEMPTTDGGANLT